MNQFEFLKTIQPFKDKLFRLAKRLLVSTEEAEDATQEIFVKLWNKNESLRNITNIEAFAVTFNVPETSPATGAVISTVGN